MLVALSNDYPCTEGLRQRVLVAVNSDCTPVRQKVMLVAVSIDYPCPECLRQTVLVAVCIDCTHVQKA